MSGPQPFNADDPRRRSPRHRTESLTCDLGTVMDMSSVGMRVSFTGKPPLAIGQTGKVRLKIPEGNLAVTGRAVWMRRKGFRRYEMGIEFLNVSRAVAIALDSLARFGFLGVTDGQTANAAAAAAASYSSGPGTAKTTPEEDAAKQKQKQEQEQKQKQEQKSKPSQKVRASVDIPDYYSILGVESGASDDDIRNAYRALARQYHPDVSPDPTSAQKFVEVHDAYEVLRDKDRRRRYDRKLAG